MSHVTLVILIAAAALAPAILDVFTAVKCVLVPSRCQAGRCSARRRQR